jgi:hypothetical protein
MVVENRERLRTRVRGMRKLWVHALVLAIAAALAAAVAIAVTWPRVAVIGAKTHSTNTPRVFTQSLWIKNTSNVGVTIRGVSNRDSSVQMIGSSLHRAASISVGKAIWIRTTYRVIDCQHPLETVPVQLRIDEWWGTKTITAQDHGLDYDGAFNACNSARQ